MKHSRKVYSVCVYSMHLHYGCTLYIHCGCTVSVPCDWVYMVGVQ